MDLGEGDAGNEPTSKTNRRAYDLIAVGFGPGANGPLTIAVDLRQGRVDLSVLQRRLAEVDGVASVAPPVLNARQDTAVLSVVPTTAPQDAQTADLVAQLRSRVLPAGAGITGPTAGAMAFSERTQERLPHVVGGVVLVSLLLLVLVFRSIVAPIKAAVMNLLSVGAAYGAVVALFQWGWGKDLLGLQAAVPVNAFVPMFMFAILFGLSMDYEVFLLSRVREEWDRTRTAAAASSRGSRARLRSSRARPHHDRSLRRVRLQRPRPVKMMGVGMAVAVLVDATLVRMVLVPSTMVLLGKWNWWLPRWLEERLPTLPVEVPEQARASAPGRTAARA
jgi:RND superfamily putative drug exporter